jgi:phosphatidylserine/phosphatidylglycerophosphate/cardiolipin synthase-like enzyme
MKINKEAIYLGLIIILIGLCGQFYYSYKWKPAREIRVYYNQEVQANKQIIKLIQEADQFVYFAVYTFTRQDIKDALVGAKHRGVIVRGLTDREQTQRLESQGKVIKELQEAGIEVLEQDHVGIMHLKTLVTEKEYASGSFNWTSAATNLNDEVLEIGTDETVRRQYQELLEKLLKRYERS